MLRRALLVLSVFALALAGTVPAGADPQAQVGGQGDGPGPELEAATATPSGSRLLKEAEPGLFVVRLADPPAATYPGGKPGLPRTRPDVAAGEKFDADHPAVRAYLRHLERERGRVLARAERELDRAVRPSHVYDAVLNGFAAFFTPGEAARVARLPGVADVRPDEVYELHTDNGPAWIDADDVWGDPADPGTRGAGVLVGVVDTGINPSNPSFADPAPVDGYVHTNPFGDGNFVGACDPDNAAHYDPAVQCNNKLVGAWNFVDDGDPAGALDVDGHGSHTASTAAGNVVDATVDSPTDASLSRRISGVAPEANIISYRGCRRDPGCPLTALTASINQAVLDGVDVINYSIGGGSRNPWADDNALAFLDARAAGVFVATSAGNSGPGAGTVGSPADAPWVTSVGASTHDRNLPNTLTSLAGGDTAPPADTVGKGFTSGYGPAPIVSAGDYPNANDPDGDPLQCMEPYPAGTFDGEIVVCERGTIARVDKGANVLAGGAGGMVLANDPASGDSLNSDPHFLPAVHIGHQAGQALLAWLSSGSDHSGEITGAVLDVDDAWGDVMAAFSSRGPNAQMDVISPNVTAPGVDIIAAYGSDDPDPAVWSLVSGTSMSSPHVAGAGALLAALRPDWTPAEIQSALMTTARTDGVRKEDSATPAGWFDMGSGRVDVAAAAAAGFVLDETIDGYVAADPREGGDPTSLNLPSMAASQCLGTCTWTRRITGTTSTSWTVSVDEPAGTSIGVEPATFDLDAGESLDVTITADVSAAATGDWLSGQVSFTPADGTVSPAHFPLAVIPSTGILPDSVDVATRRDAGSWLVSGLQAMASPELTVDVHGLAEADVIRDEVGQDPNRGDPYSPISANFVTTFDVPAGTARLVAEIFEAESPDLDLFVGTGEQPSLETEVCRGTTAASFEYCDVPDPEAGTWWLMVQAWQASSAEAQDAFALALGLVPDAPTGTMTAEAPASVAQGEEFDVRLFFDLDTSVGDRWYGAFSLGSTAATPGDIGRVPVDLVREDDDVTKAASHESAAGGDTVTYEITVQPNLLPEDVTYTITDEIPAGMTYVEGSATNGATVSDGVLTWTGTMPSPRNVERDFAVTTNAADPGCAVPFGDGTWVDFGALGFPPNPAFDGGDVLYTGAFTSGAPFTFYGRTHQGMAIAPTGQALIASSDFGAWWVPQTLPDPTPPNSVVAGLWGDFEIVYDADADSGMRLLTLGTDAEGWAIVDYDQLELYGGSADTWSAQMWIRRSPVDGQHDVVFAYDDLGPLGGPHTIGVEDQLGEHATALVNNGSAAGAIDDSTIVCFAYEGGGAETIAYEVTVDAGASGTLTNSVVHDTDNPGSQPETTSVDVEALAAEVVAVEVEPASVRLRTGQTAQLAATAVRADGTRVDVTAEAAWTSSNPQVATVDGGLVTAVGGGRAVVTAAYDGHEATAGVHVTGPPADRGPPPRP